VLLALAVVAVVAVLAGPHLWAWYHLAAARSDVEQYRTADARDHLRRCLAVWPSNVEARLLAARAARRAGEFAEAEKHLDEARKAAGEKAPGEIALEWALLRAASGDVAAVEESLQSRLDREPALGPLIWEALAEGYRRTSRIREALAWAEKWLQREPDNSQALLVRGDIHRHVGAMNNAADDYRRVVERVPGHREARRHLVRCLVPIGRFQEALDHLDVLRPSAAEDQDLLVLAARCRHDTGRKDQARQVLKEVLAVHPSYGPALRELGREEALDGNDAEAEGWLRKALEAQPHDYHTAYTLAQCLQRLGKTAEAARQSALAAKLKDRIERLGEIRRREMSLRPFDPALHAELGSLLLGVGDKESGVRWLLSAVRLDPRQAAAHAALADYYQGEGDRARAAFHRRQAGKTGDSP
jgi:tetratricopeptide (TPR) repeat protein